MILLCLEAPKITQLLLSTPTSIKRDIWLRYQTSTRVSEKEADLTQPSLLKFISKVLTNMSRGIFISFNKFREERKHEDYHRRGTKVSSNNKRSHDLQDIAI